MSIVCSDLAPCHVSVVVGRLVETHTSAAFSMGVEAACMFRVGQDSVGCSKPDALPDLSVSVPQINAQVRYEMGRCHVLKKRWNSPLFDTPVKNGGG